MSFSEKIRNALTVSALLALVPSCAAMGIYLGNLREYVFTLQQLLVVTGVFSFGIFGFWMVFQACFIRARFYPMIFHALFALALCLWIQGSFLLWPLGGTADTLHRFSEHPIFGTLELLIFSLVFWLVFRFRTVVDRKCGLYASFILAIQVFALVPPLMAYRESSLEKFLSIDCSGIHQVSNGENVLIVVLDSLESDYFQKTLADSGPELSEALKDFEFFPRLISRYPQTFYALPTLLTGSPIFDETMTWDVRKTVFEQTDASIFRDSASVYFERLNQMYMSEYALFSTLKRNGFQTEVYPFAGTWVYLPQNSPDIANIDPKTDSIEKSRILSLTVLAEEIIPCAMYRISPLIFKPTAYHATEKGLERAYKIYTGETWKVLDTSSENPDKKVAESAEVLPAVADRPFFDFPKEAKPDVIRHFKLIHLEAMNRWNVTSNTAMEQCYFQKGIVPYLEYLKGCGGYEKSWIVILGDHGRHGSPVSRQFNPALLIKKPGVNQSEMTVRDDVVFMRDIAPSLLTEMGIPLGTPFSLWHQTEEQKDERNVAWVSFVEKNR